MIPVLAVSDPVAARDHLIRHFGFRDGDNGVMSFGASRLLLTARNSRPAGFIDLALDHVAFAVPDADAIFHQISLAGGALDRDFTPDGVRAIPEFWTHGVRFVFFAGPDATPFEFCAKTQPATTTNGHDHYGIRTGNVDAMEARILAFGGSRLAAHSLGDPARPVNVRFVSAGDAVFEIFDEAPFRHITYPQGWVGLVRG